MGKEEEQDKEVVDGDVPMREDSSKRNYREDPGYLEAMRLIEEEDRIEDEENAAAAAAAKPGRKRAYARKVGEQDVATTKRYKCNYWADPTYVKKLKNTGQLLARSLAVMHQADRDIAASRARRGAANV